jgi:hypothetical protein
LTINKKNDKNFFMPMLIGKSMKETTTLGWAWVLIALVACGLVITFIVQGM